MMLLIITTTLIIHDIVENIMNQHHYTKTAIETVAAAVNAGVCLEDASTANNILSLAGEAVKAVTTYNNY